MTIDAVRQKIAKNMPTSAVASAKLGDPAFRRYDIEAWFIAKLGAHGRHIEDGASDYDSRKARIRTVIQTLDMGQAHIGSKDGQPETFAQFFERFYGEPL